MQKNSSQSQYPNVVLKILSAITVLLLKVFTLTDRSGLNWIIFYFEKAQAYISVPEGKMYSFLLSDVVIL